MDHKLSFGNKCVPPFSPLQEVLTIPRAAHTQSCCGRLILTTPKPDTFQISPVTSPTSSSAVIQSWHMQGSERLCPGELC